MSEKTATPNFEDTAANIREFNEKLVAAAKQNGSMSLDVQEKTLAGMLQFAQQAADATKVDAISAITKANADYITSTSKVFTGIARDALK